MILSAILTFYIPRLLGVTSYGYWQLYIFYLSYAGFFHFGIIDGLYLKIGGDHYESLNKKNIKGQLLFLSVFEFFVAISIIFFSLFFVKDSDKQIILSLVSISGFFTIIRSFILYLLQATNRIKEYAKLTKMDRYIYFLLAMGYVILGGRNYILLIILDIFSRMIVLLFSFRTISDILKNEMASQDIVITEIFENLRIGIKLMFGNIAGQLILGVIRFSIEKNWSVDIFGQLSLTLSISNMILVFVSSISVVMFPLLRRTSMKILPTIYSNIRRIITLLSYTALVFYPLLSRTILLILPKYEQSIYFMSIIFPIFIFESRMSLITMTFFKTLRKENKILFLNVFSLLLSLLSSYVTVFILDNLTMTIISIVFILSFRAFLGDVILSKELNVKLRKDIVLEILLTILFIVGNIFQVFYIYVVFMILILLLSANKIKKNFLFLHKLAKS